MCRNHGGRQLDQGVGSIDVLPEVVEAVGRRARILVDGGINHCTDVVKALVHLAGNLNPLEPGSGDKGFPFHGPFEWLCHGGIEVGDETLDPLLEMVL
jgi:FMN-dependent dehydrogenase